MNNDMSGFVVGQLVEVVSAYAAEGDLAHVRAVNGDQVQVSYYYLDRREWRSAASLRATTKAVGYSD